MIPDYFLRMPLAKAIDEIRSYGWKLEAWQIEDFYEANSELVEELVRYGLVNDPEPSAPFSPGLDDGWERIERPSPVSPSPSELSGDGGNKPSCQDCQSPAFHLSALADAPSSIPANTDNYISLLESVSGLANPFPSKEQTHPSGSSSISSAMCGASPPSPWAAAAARPTTIFLPYMASPQVSDLTRPANSGCSVISPPVQSAEPANPDTRRRDRSKEIPKQPWGCLPKYSNEIPFLTEHMCVQVFQNPNMTYDLKVEINHPTPEQEDVWIHVFSASCVPSQYMIDQKYIDIICDFYDWQGNQEHADYLAKVYEPCLERFCGQQSAVLAASDGRAGNTPRDRPVHILGSFSLDGNPALNNREATYRAMTGVATIWLGDEEYTVVLDRKAKVGRRWKWSGYWHLDQVSITGGNGDAANIPKKYL